MEPNTILWIIAGIIIFFVIREVICWYWKINEILEEKKKQTRILEEMLYTMNPRATYFNKEDNEKSTPK